MAKNIVLTAIFSDALKADDAMSNLTEAEFKPQQIPKNNKIIIQLVVNSDTKAAAWEILTDSQADSINEK